MAKRGNGEGSIYYSEKLKRWVGQFTAGHKSDGSIDRKTVYAKTRKEVAQKIIEKQNEVNNKTFINKSDVIFKDLANSIIDEEHKNNKVKDTTYLRKKDTLKIIEKTQIYKMKVQDISIRDINVALSILIDYSNSTISKVKILISFVLDKAVLYKIISNNPFTLKGAITVPKSNKENKKVDALTVDEQKAFLNELNNCNDTYKDVLLIALYTGMRIGEILALSSEDIDLDNNTIHITKTLTKDINDKVIVGNTTKTYAGTRSIPILPQIRYIFEQNTNKNLLFTSNNKLIYVSTINTHFKKICKDAGIRIASQLKKKKKEDANFINLKTSDVNSHMLRHTFATRCIEAGMQAVVLQKLLGHKDISVTLNTYTSVFDKFQDDEIDKITKYFNATFNATQIVS